MHKVREVISHESNIYPSTYTESNISLKQKIKEMNQRIIQLLALAFLYFPVPVASYTSYRDAESCEIVGDGDIYGIGIRLSLYIQSFTAMIAFLGATHEELCALRVGFNAVATAIVINYLKDMHRNSFVYLEFWLIFALLEYFLWVFNFFSFFAILLEANRRPPPTKFFYGAKLGDKGRSDLEIVLTAFRINCWEAGWPFSSVGCFSIAWSALLSFILLGTQIWIYFSGLNHGHNPECEAKINFYGYIDMYNHHWVGFLRVVSIVGAIAILFLALSVLPVLAYGLAFEIEKIYETKVTNNPDDPTLIKVTGYTPPPLSSKPSHITCIILIFSILPFISGIVWAENTIRINSIDLSAAPISSSGQLIALLIAIFTSLPMWWTVFVEIMKQRMNKKAKDRSQKNTSNNETVLNNEEAEEQDVNMPAETA